MLDRLGSSKIFNTLRRSNSPKKEADVKAKRIRKKHRPAPFSTGQVKTLKKRIGTQNKKLIRKRTRVEKKKEFVQTLSPFNLKRPLTEFIESWNVLNKIENPGTEVAAKKLEAFQNIFGLFAEKAATKSDLAPVFDNLISAFKESQLTSQEIKNFMQDFVGQFKGMEDFFSPFEWKMGPGDNLSLTLKRNNQSIICTEKLVFLGTTKKGEPQLNNSTIIKNDHRIEKPEKKYFLNTLVDDLVNNYDSDKLPSDNAKVLRSMRRAMSAFGINKKTVLKKLKSNKTLATALDNSFKLEEKRKVPRLIVKFLASKDFKSAKKLSEMFNIAGVDPLQLFGNKAPKEVNILDLFIHIIDPEALALDDLPLLDSFNFTTDQKKLFVRLQKMKAIFEKTRLPEGSTNEDSLTQKSQIQHVLGLKKDNITVEKALIENIKQLLFRDITQSIDQTKLLGKEYREARDQTKLLGKEYTINRMKMNLFTKMVGFLDVGKEKLNKYPAGGLIDRGGYATIYHVKEDEIKGDRKLVLRTLHGLDINEQEDLKLNLSKIYLQMGLLKEYFTEVRDLNFNTGKHVNSSQTLRMVMDRKIPLEALVIRRQVNIKATAKRICGGLIVLKKLGLIHGDLKLQNILGEGYIIDFDMLSRVGSEIEEVGSTQTMAPELFLKKGKQNATATDTYAFFWTIMQMITRDPIYSISKALERETTDSLSVRSDTIHFGRGTPPFEELKGKLLPHLIPVFGEEAAKEIVKMAHPKPNERPELADILRYFS